MSGGIIGLITARGGSKGIPRKNIRILAGKPLIAWTIQAALASSSLSQTIVSTDDEEIARVSRDWGAQVPFTRPAELARDDSTSIVVVKHALRWLAEHGAPAPEYLLLLQPTSPLRTAQDIDAAAELARQRNATAVVSVCAADRHPYLCKRVLDDGTLADFVPNVPNYERRQDLPPAYALNGAIYLNRCESLLHDETFTPRGTYPYVMPAERSLDVDTLWDLHMAELILTSSAEDRRTESQ